MTLGLWGHPHASLFCGLSWIVVETRRNGLNDYLQCCALRNPFSPAERTCPSIFLLKNLIFIQWHSEQNKFKGPGLYGFLLCLEIYTCAPAAVKVALL